MKHTRHTTKKKRHFFEYLIINIFIFIGIGVISFFVFNISLFNQFTQAFKDFTITDIYYSQIKSQDKIYRGPLVLINIENKSREDLAFLIKRVEEGNPKVVGLDIIFPDKKDSASDKLLKQILGSYKNIITPYIASFDDVTKEKRNNDYFEINSKAFVNIIGDDRKYSTIRYYYPAYDNIPSFTTAIIQEFDEQKGQSLLKKNNQKTEIRYFGDLQNFTYQTFEEVMTPSFDTDSLKDKIVLLGYLGLQGNKNKLDEDVFFTPMNPRLSGRSLPDMYGAVLIANILRMELDNDFIYTFPTWLNWLLAFVLSWILLPWFIKYWVHKAVWFHLFTMLLQLSTSLVFVYLTIMLYAKANVKIESSVVLVSVLLLGDFILFYDSIVQFLRLKLKWKFHSKFFEGEH